MVKYYNNYYLCQSLLEEKEVKQYALQVLRYLCQHDNDHICINEIYKNSGVNIHFEKDENIDAEDKNREEYIKSFEQVIKYLIDKEFLSYYIKPSEVNEDKFQDLLKTTKFYDTCGKVLVSSLKQYDVDIFQ